MQGTLEGDARGDERQEVRPHPGRRDDLLLWRAQYPPTDRHHGGRRDRVHAPDRALAGILARVHHACAGRRLLSARVPVPGRALYRDVRRLHAQRLAVLQGLGAVSPDAAGPFGPSAPGGGAGGGLCRGGRWDHRAAGRVQRGRRRPGADHLPRHALAPFAGVSLHGSPGFGPFADLHPGEEDLLFRHHGHALVLFDRPHPGLAARQARGSGRGAAGEAAESEQART